MSDPAIKVENLSKLYKIGALKQRHDTLRDQLVEGVKSLFSHNGRSSTFNPQPSSITSHPPNTIWAVKDVTFEINRGDVVGIIGRNGAGKSTILKILSRIIEPTEGRAEIYGRVASLLEVGTGFHYELTGRENVYLNGAILGMRKAEIDQKFDEIVDFSGIEKFIDTPAKRYSSGMSVRLAFAVAAHLDPEILIIDEVLAVGDAAFQKKCLGKMEKVAREGRTVLLVSHNLAVIENICHKACVFEGGELRFIGRPKEATDYYLREAYAEGQTSRGSIVDLTNSTGRSALCRPLLRRLELYMDSDRLLNGALKIGAYFKACIYFQLAKPTAAFDVGLGFDNLLGQRVFTAHTLFQPDRNQEKRIGEQIYVCEIPRLDLVPGEYKIKVALDIGGSEVDSVEDATRLTISESDYYGSGKVPWNGLVVIPHAWQLK